MPGRRRELIGEDAQCAAIALAKGMQIVEIAVKRGSSRDETSHVEAAQGVSRLQCRQRGFEARVDFGARRIRNFIAERGALEHPVLDMTGRGRPKLTGRSEEHTSELQSLMRTSYAVFCLKK